MVPNFKYLNKILQDQLTNQNDLIVAMDIQLAELMRDLKREQENKLPTLQDVTEPLDLNKLYMFCRNRKRHVRTAVGT